MEAQLEAMEAHPEARRLSLELGAFHAFPRYLLVHSSWSLASLFSLELYLVFIYIHLSAEYKFTILLLPKSLLNVL
jgi:hypothetical protein